MSAHDDVVRSYVGGQPLTSSGDQTHQVLDPSDGSTVATVQVATAADVDTAVAAATAAYPEWSGATPGERSAALTRLAHSSASAPLSSREVESRQAGKPIRLSTGFDVPGTVDNVAFFSGAARNLEGKAAAEYSGRTRR